MTIEEAIKLPYDLKIKFYRILRYRNDIKILSDELCAWGRINGCEKEVKAMLKKEK